jgi:hypothetical protein
MQPALVRHLELCLRWQPGVTLELGEVIVSPGANALWECRPEIRDGWAVWDSGSARVLQCLRIGPFAREGAAGIMARVDGRQFVSREVGPDGWAEWFLPPVLARQVAVALPAGGPVPALAAVAIPTRNLAAQRPYTLSPAFPARYPDSGRELADGAVSADGFPDGLTVGWFGVAPSVTFDLGREQPLDRLRIHAQGDGYAAVHFPAALEVAVAAEDGSWQTLPPRQRPLVFALSAEAPATRRLGWAECSLDGVVARFLRLRFATPRGGWTMLSEIEILGSGRNLAAVATYALQPAPSSESKYSDNRDCLTDGAYATNGWNGCAGWHEGTPEITLDLQRQVPLNLVVVHLVGGGSGAVYFPERLETYLSLDGADWVPAAVSTDRPDEGTGTECRTGVMTVHIEPPRSARFVRLVLSRRGWLMVHEVEVY